MKVITNKVLNKFLKAYSHCNFVLILGFCITLFLGCSSSSEAEWYFDGNIEDLMLSKIDSPVGWEFDTWDNRLVVENLVVGYHTSVDEYLNSGHLIQNVLIFENQQEAIKALDEEYQFFLDLTARAMEKEEIEDWDYTSPSKFSYKSPIADEFRVIFYPDFSYCGAVIGYNYRVYARYGNVLSEFSALLEDEELTGISVDDTNVLPWEEVEPLLRRIDEQFSKAGKGNP